MPLIRSQSSRNSIEQEGRILLAIQAIKNQEIFLICKALRILTSCLLLYGTALPASQIAPKLAPITEIEKESLVRWILSGFS